MRAVIYPRVSSQIQKDNHTIDSQISSLPAYVRARGWSLVKAANTYIDDGRTAKAGHLEKRDGWNRLARDMEAGGIDVVVVVDQDRLTRSEDLIERSQILGTFQRCQVKIAVASTGQLLDLNSSEGDLLAMLQAWVAAEHNRKHRERIKRGKLEAISKGKKPAGPTPFGYSYDRPTGLWSIHPKNGPIVVEIFERVASGESCYKIAFDLHTRGVERPRSGFWTRERVWALVHSRTYLGEWTADKKNKLKVPVPRIIEDDLFARAHESLLRYGLRGFKRNKYVSLCQGIGRCAICQSRIVLSQADAHDGKRKLRYYVCSRRLRVRFGEQKCSLPSRRVELIDEAVWNRVQEVLTSPERLDRALTARKADSQIDDSNGKADLEDFKRRLSKLQRTEQVLVERFSRGMVSEAVMDEQLKRMTAERKLLDQQIVTAEEQVARAHGTTHDANVLRQAVEDLAFDFDNVTPENKRELLVRLVPGREDYFIEFGPNGVTMKIILNDPAPNSVKSGAIPALLRRDSASTSSVRKLESCLEIPRRPPAAMLSSSTPRCASTSAAPARSSRATNRSARACA